MDQTGPPLHFRFRDPSDIQNCDSPAIAQELVENLRPQIPRSTALQGTSSTAVRRAAYSSVVIGSISIGAVFLHCEFSFIRQREIPKPPHPPRSTQIASVLIANSVASIKFNLHSRSIVSEKQQLRVHSSSFKKARYSIPTSRRSISIASSPARRLADNCPFQSLVAAPHQPTVPIPPNAADSSTASLPHATPPTVPTQYNFRHPVVHIMPTRLTRFGEIADFISGFANLRQSITRVMQHRKFGVIIHRSKMPSRFRTVMAVLVSYVSA